MANYPTLRSGSSGDEVKKLQQSLTDAGYNVGSAGADGIYGSNTANAVKQYQKDHGLAVDGIAGEQTLGRLYGSSSGGTTGSASGTTAQNTGTTTNSSGDTGTATPDYSGYLYDPSDNEAYIKAQTTLDELLKNKPVYAGTYDSDVDNAYAQLMNREKFSYDVDEDALYQQYKNQYIQQGRTAMQDVMGQAAALSGGYGNSYAATAGSQAYQAYLSQLNDVVPELYGMALDQYNQEGQALLDRYNLAADMRDNEYGEYQDETDRWWQDVAYADEQVGEAYDQGYNNWYKAWQIGTDADTAAYNRRLDSRDYLINLITTTGYTPTAEELAAAGMSAGEAQALRNYYDKQENAAGEPSGSGGNNGNNQGGGGIVSIKDKEPDFSSFNKNMWYEYFDAIRTVEDQASAKQELAKFIEQGLIPEKFVGVATVAAQGGMY